MQNLLDQICVFLGGTAAEEVLLEGRSASAGGAAGSDLHHATLAALRIEASYGLGQGLAYMSADRDEELMLSLQMSFFLRDRVEALLAEQMNRTRILLRRHASTVHSVATALLARKTLMSSDVLRLFEGTPPHELHAEAAGGNTLAAGSTVDLQGPTTGLAKW